MEIGRSAEEELTIANEVRNAVASRARSPWWYHPATGLSLGVAVVAVLLIQGVGAGFVVILMAVALSALELARRRAKGSSTTEFGRGQASVHAAVFLLLSLAALAVGWYFVKEEGVAWVAWIAGLAVCVFVEVGGWVFERTLATAPKR